MIDFYGDFIQVNKMGESNTAFPFASHISHGWHNIAIFTGLFSGISLFNGIELISEGRTDLFVACFTFPMGVDDIVLPKTEELTALNYPNPFNPETTVIFNLPRDGEVELIVYNVKGQRIRVLLEEYLQQGEHHVTWDGRDDSGSIAGSGIYLYRLRSSSDIFTGRMTLLK